MLHVLHVASNIILVLALVWALLLNSHHTERAERLRDIVQIERDARKQLEEALRRQSEAASSCRITAASCSQWPDGVRPP